jgi:uncharacterized protein YndB with AHSA1/START domain
MSEPNQTGTKPQTETRSIDLQIEIPASAQAIWEGLTDPELIGYWFAPEARVDPKVGGEYWVSWGGGMDMGMTISAWEPGKFLQLRSDMPLPDGSTATLLCDFAIEVEGGTAKLRLVNSGFSTDASWDDEITNMTKGWTVFLHNLRNLVSHPSGIRPKGFMITRKGSKPAVDLYGKIVGDIANRDPGESYAANWAEPVSGTVQFLLPPNMFIGTATELNDGRITLMVEGNGPKPAVTLLIQTFGYPDDFKALRSRWTAWLEGAVNP